MDDTRRAAAERKARDRANRSTRRVQGVVVATDGTVARVSAAGRTVPAVIPASVAGVAIGATVVVQDGPTPVVESVLGAVAATSARATRATNGPSLSASTWTQVAGLTTVYDPAGIIDPTTGVVTIPTPGVWRAALTYPWGNYGSAFDRFLAWMRGTSAPGKTAAAKRCTQSGRWWESLEYEDLCAAGDTLTAWTWTATTSSGAEPAFATAPLTAITVERVS